MFPRNLPGYSTSLFMGHTHTKTNLYSLVWLLFPDCRSSLGQPEEQVWKWKDYCDGDNDEAEEWAKGSERGRSHLFLSEGDVCHQVCSFLESSVIHSNRCTDHFELFLIIFSLFLSLALSLQMWWVCYSTGWDAEAAGSSRGWEKDSELSAPHGHPAETCPHTAFGRPGVWSWAVVSRARRKDA